MKIIEILPNVYGVKVPSDSTELELICLDSMYLRLKTDSEYLNIKLGLGTLENIKILGTLTKDEISFDASEVVEHLMLYFENYGKMYQYIKNGFIHHTYSHEEYFRSSLPNEIYFKNPFKEPNCDCNTEYDREGCPDKCYQWINANNGITEKLLILQKL